MWNLGPFEIGVLVIVALVVFGPDRLPTLAKDAARMIKTLRDLAQGARTQLSDELGPGFKDLDIRSLNPRVALQKALFEDDEPVAAKVDPAAQAAPSKPVDFEKPVSRPDPLARGEAAPYDDDAT